MANSASPTKPESSKAVDDEDDTPEYQAIIDGFAGASVEKKAGLIQEMNALYANEPWIAPIVSRGYVWANSKKVKGLVTDILSTPYWSELWLDA